MYDMTKYKILIYVVIVCDIHIPPNQRELRGGENVPEKEPSFKLRFSVCAMLRNWWLRWFCHYDEVTVVGRTHSVMVHYFVNFGSDLFIGCPEVCVDELKAVSF
jgi:hypothetical protein